MVTFRISEKCRDEMMSFLFQDENESAMLGICSYDTSESGDVIIMLRRLIEVPHAICQRYPDFISWPTEFCDNFLKEALDENMTLIKIHCHPSDYRKFSTTDNSSDLQLFDYFNAFFNDGRPSASLVVVPNGFMFGRLISKQGKFITIDKIALIGELQEYYFPDESCSIPEYLIRNQQAFGNGTTEILRKLKIGVVGCSGLGSPTILELARSGIGELVIVDDDTIEVENLNRIFGASHDDIGKSKVDFFKEKIQSYGLDVKVTCINSNICKSESALTELTYCDHIFGCVDKYLPREIINRLATFFIIGYTDLAVGLKPDGNGGIISMIGWVRYLLPGGSSLISREMYSSIDLEPESLELLSPEEYKSKRNAGYLAEVNEGSPTVISLNTTVASLAVTDFLHRIHGFRNTSDLGFCIDFCENAIEPEMIFPESKLLAENVGRGKTEPFLNLNFY